MHLNRTISVTLLAVFCLWGCSGGENLTAPPAPPARVVAAAPKVESPVAIGDVLEIFVNEDPSFGGRYEVRERGDIIIPEVGRIGVEGLSVVGAEQKVKSALERGQLTSATVILDRVSSAGGAGRGPAAQEQATTLFLSGKVNRPGRHVVPDLEGRKPGIYEAILICGGLGRFADERDISVLRRDPETGKKRSYSINLSKIKDGTIEDVPIQEADILVVKEKTFSL